MILRSVCTVTVLGMLSLICYFFIVSTALTIASCSGCSLENLLCSAYQS